MKIVSTALVSIFALVASQAISAAQDDYPIGKHVERRGYC
jgi:hypothetical protein